MIVSVGYQPLPLDLVAALPELPFDAYLVRDGRMVLYAARGSDPRAVLDRARGGLPVHVPLEDAADLGRFLVAALVRALQPSAADGVRPADRGVRVAAIASALLAPLFTADERLDPAAFAAAQAAVDLIARASATDPGLAGAVLRRPPVRWPAAQRPAAGPRSDSAPRPVTAGRRAAGHALDGLVTALALADARRAIHGDEERIRLARGAAFRDVGLPRVTGGDPRRRSAASPVERAALRRHPDVGVALLTAVTGSRPAYADIVLEHHERVDGSGYPVGRRGRDVAPVVALVGLADTFVAVASRGSAVSAEEAVRVLRFAARGRFDDDHVWSLVELLAAGRLLRPAGRSGRSAIRAPGRRADVSPRGTRPSSAPSRPRSRAGSCG